MNSFCVQNLEVLFLSYHEKKTSGNTSPRLLEESSNRSTLLTIHNTTSIINKCIKQDPEIFLISCLFRKSTPFKSFKFLADNSERICLLWPLLSLRTCFIRVVRGCRKEKQSNPEMLGNIQTTIPNYTTNPTRAAQRRACHVNIICRISCSKTYVLS